jgi:hypothetical protein
MHIAGTGAFTGFARTCHQVGRRVGARRASNRRRIGGGGGGGLNILAALSPQPSQIPCLAGGGAPHI